MEPLGQSQVLQYLKHLASDHAITLLTFEKPEDLADHGRLSALKSEAKQAGIDWRPLRYHKRPSALATAYDLALGLLFGSWLVLRKKICIIHARSYVPSVIALGLKKLFGVKYIFDMRGFWADERVDGGIWPKGSRLYRVAKWFEQRFFCAADTVVSLTHAGVEEIKQFPYLQGRLPSFVVIPTCTNLQMFILPTATTEPNDRPFTLGYVGSVGTWYLLDEMLRLFQCVRQRRPQARLLIINRNEHALLRERLQQVGVPLDQVEIKAVEHRQVVNEMQRMDAGMLLIKPVFSKLASAPTKLGEFLACGVPCVGNTGVGDVGSILSAGPVGVVVSAFDDQALGQAVDELLALCADPAIATRCRRVAEQHFSLEQGVASYREIYQSLAR